MLKYVIKRDGRKVEHNPDKITDAIYKAAKSIGGNDYDLAKSLSNKVHEKIYEVFNDNEIPTIEQIQDIVEKVLIDSGHATTAKAYILYRNERTKSRNMKTRLMNTINELTYADAIDSDIKRENANIDGDTAMGTMLKYGSATSKEFFEMNVLTPEEADAHKNGDIHIHDFDFYTLTTTCCQIDLTKLFTGGFHTGHGFIREPSSIRTYASLCCIAIQSNQNDQHGGQSIPKFDYDMAPGVKKSYIKNYLINLAKAICLYTSSDEDAVYKELKEFCKQMKAAYYLYPSLDQEANKLYMAREKSYIMFDSKSIIRSKRIPVSDLQKFAMENAIKETDDDTYQAMESLVHNLNTMAARAGAQVPFSSINYGTDTSPEGRMVIKNILLAEDSGLGNGETPIFPIHIFKVKEGVNYNTEDPNYDMLQLACKVSAKRLFPNFSFIDAPFNIQYYKKGDPDTEVAYMGCVCPDEVVRYKIDGNLYIESIERMYHRISEIAPLSVYGVSKYFDTSDMNVTIYDTTKSIFVKCNKIICNPGDLKTWKHVKFSNGGEIFCTEDHPFIAYSEDYNKHIIEIRAKDLTVGTRIPLANLNIGVASSYCADNTTETIYDKLKGYQWFIGYVFTNKDFRYNEDSFSIVIKDSDSEINDTLLLRLANTYTECEKIVDGEIHYSERGISRTINADKTQTLTFTIPNHFKNLIKYWIKKFGIGTSCFHIPPEVYSWKYEYRCSFLGGIIDSLFVSDTPNGFDTIRGEFRNRETALQVVELFYSVNARAKYENTDDGKYYVHGELTRTIHVYSPEMYNHVVQANTVSYYKRTSEYFTTEENHTAIVKDISNCSNFQNSYDVETETGLFDVSGIISHNCRTRVLGNVHDKDREIVTGRGNLSFTSINIPRLAIEANHDIDKFFELLDNMITLTTEQLLHRFEIQSNKKVRNYPFLMGQGVWIDSDKLGPDDTVGDVLKHGTLSIGFIGLAEALVALIGEHHGESEKAQELGLSIVSHMRKRMDDESKKTGLNFSLLGTPAEGLSGRFVKIDAKKYGIISGVTDKEYYTNSFHVPVYHRCTAAEKIRLEAPYHNLTNAGHISYIEMDGDPSNNVEAFISVIRYMKECGIGYGSINHPVDRDPVCGYTGIIDDYCPKCGRREDNIKFDRIRRITGYLVGTLDRFNDAKKAEVRDRVNHKI